MKKLVFLTVTGIFTCISGVVQGESAFEEGEKLFMMNKPEEAKVLLESALLRDNRNEKTYFYLGIIYGQLKKPQKAIDILRNGLLIATSMKDQYYFRLGNIYYDQGEYTLAEKNYILAIAESSLYSEAYLNRAQSRFHLNRYPDAVEDYKTYLRLKPKAPQRAEIEKLIALLEQAIKDQVSLLDSVLDNIKNASRDTKTESAGTEDIINTGDEDIDIIE